MNSVKTKDNVRAYVAPLRKFFFQHGHVNVPNLPEFESLYDFCNTVRASRSRLPSHVIEELDNMGFRWEMNISNELRWHYHYAELKTFYQTYGHTRVKDKDGYESLASWIQRQRRAINKLSPDKKRLLKKINFSWSDDIKKEKDQYWLDMFEKLKAFYKKHGHANVPDRYKEDVKLGRWVSTMRAGEERLADWKRKLLKTVKFKFSPDIQRDLVNHRQNHFKKLESFYKKFGHANVPENYKDHKLSVFVAYLRQRDDRISTAERRQLKKWGFLFSEDIREKWDKQFTYHLKKLEKFKEKYGHCRVSSAFADKTLARWVAKQRKLKKFGKLQPEREKTLKKIGFAFYDDVAELKEKKWIDKYNRLLKFKKKYGHTVVPESYKDKELVYWVQHQRQANSKKTLYPGRKKLLEKIGFVWKAR